MLPITHTYGSIGGLYSAREPERLAKVTEEQFENHLKELKNLRVEFFYASNTSCLGELGMKDMLKMKSLIKKLVDLGVENFIVAHPFAMELIKEQVDGKIKLSVILEIDDVIRFKYFIDKVDIINIATSVNRDFTFLKSIKKYRHKIEFLCNETCLYMCPFRASHYTIESHRSKENNYPNDYPVENCYDMLTNVELMKSRFILPEWIEIYKKYGAFFKISGRTFPEEFIFKTSEHYSRGYSPENIIELFPIVTGSITNEQNHRFENRTLLMSDLGKKKFLDYFIEKGHECRYICPCNHCSEYSICITEK